MSLTQEQKDEIFAEALLSNKFEDIRKLKCVDLGKRIVNKQVSDEDIIIEVAVLATRYVVWMLPINDPENGELVKAVANGNAQFVIDYLQKYNSNPFAYFNAYPKEGAALAPLDMRLSQVSDIFLTMMSNIPFDDLSKYDDARTIIFDTFLRLFGGYFLLGAVLGMDKNDNITVNRFENIGTRYYYNEKYPDNIQVHRMQHGFVFSKFGDNLTYDKFTPLEIRAAMESPFPTNLSLQCKLSDMAQKQIKVVEEAQTANANRKAEQDKREAKVEAARKAFEVSGNAGVSVIGEKVIPVNGGRRTKRHKKRSNKKRSGNKRSDKRSNKRSNKSRRR